MTAIDTVVIGAGPAGLAVSQQLAQHGIAHKVFEKGEAVAESWRQYYDSLVLHTGKHGSALPDLDFGKATPLFPPRRDVLTYFEEYAARFTLPIDFKTSVTRVARHGPDFTVETDRGIINARAVVVASGMFSNPNMPRFPGDTEFRGTILHSAQYRNPAQFRNQTALVVGAGNSGAEIAAELAAAGAEVSISIRNGAVIQPLMLLGIPTQYWGILLHGLPSPMATAVMSGFRSLQSGRQRHIALIPQRMGQLPAGRVPIIGDRLLEAVKCGKVRVRSGIERFTADAVVFSGGGMEAYSHVILATGYRPAHNFLENLDAQRTPGLFVVGLNNSLAGTLWHIRHEAQRIPLSIRAYLR